MGGLAPPVERSTDVVALSLICNGKLKKPPAREADLTKSRKIEPVRPGDYHRAAIRPDEWASRLKADANKTEVPRVTPKSAD
jgi:hypothetical protein